MATPWSMPNTIYIPPLTKKPEQQRFTMQSGILTGNDTGGAAQVAAAHCPNEQTYRWRTDWH